jgi:hypothetical protein
MLKVPPVAKVTVSGVIDIVPTIHYEEGGKDIDIVIVQVSPGVVNVVGEIVPSDQLARVFILPATLVVQAVEKPL